jgi:hypothetical protein
LRGPDDEYIQFASDITIDTTPALGEIRLDSSSAVYASPALQVDNLKLDGNTLSTTNTNGSLIFEPNGNGPIQFTSYGNSRGTYAVDLQRYKTNVSQVASGFYSTLLGGVGNTASHLGSVVIGGALSQAGGSYATVINGSANQAVGPTSVVLAGTNCYAGEQSSVAMGFAKTIRWGEIASAISGGNSTAGASQQGTVVLGDLVSANSTFELTANGVNALNTSSTFTNYFKIPDATLVNFDVQVSLISSTNNDLGGWYNARGGIIVKGSPAAAALVGPLIEEYHYDISGTEVIVDANSSTDYRLRVRVTAPTSHSMYACATIRYTQMSAGTP